MGHWDPVLVPLSDSIHDAISALMLDAYGLGHGACQFQARMLRWNNASVTASGFHGFLIWDRSVLFKPILELKSGHLLEMIRIASNQHPVINQRGCGDQAVVCARSLAV